MSILNANDAKNSLKGAAIQKSSFDVLVITTEIMFNVVLKHGTALNAGGTPVPAALCVKSGNVTSTVLERKFRRRGWFSKWVAHFDDAASKIRLKTKAYLMPNDEDKFENKGEEFRKVFHYGTSAAKSPKRPPQVYGHSGLNQTLKKWIYVSRQNCRRLKQSRKSMMLRIRARNAHHPLRGGFVSSKQIS